MENFGYNLLNKHDLPYLGYSGNVLQIRTCVNTSWD